MEQSFENEFSSWFTRLRTFVESISIKLKNTSQPNSEKQVNKLNRSLRYSKLETKINHSLIFINQLLNQNLIYNKDIPRKPSKKREYLLEPSTPFSSLQKLKEILANAKGYVKVLNTYVDSNTLDVLFCLPKNISIMLLTENIGGADRAKPFLRSCNRFKIEKPHFQIRKCKKGLFHDRYIISRDTAYNVGSSLKDLRKKLSSIIEITETKTEIEKQFDKIWATSNQLI